MLFIVVLSVELPTYMYSFVEYLCIRTFYAKYEVYNYEPIRIDFYIRLFRKI